MKRLIASLSVALVVGLAGCTERATLERVDGPGVEDSKSERAEEKTTGGPVAFGESVEVKKDAGARLKVTIGAPADLDPARASFPPEVGKYVAVNAQAELLAGTIDNISDEEFTLVDAQGNRYQATTVSLENVFLHLLTAGQPVSGTIVYDVPVDATGFTVEYAPTDANEQPMGVLGTWK